MKELAKKVLKSTLGAPSLWFAFGAVLIGVGLVLSYHRSQVEADFAMAVRVGPPAVQPIETADPAQSGEVNVMVRFDPKAAVTVKIGAPGERLERIAVPLFPATEVPQRPLDGELNPLTVAHGLVILPPGSLDAATSKLR
ncbi:MAG: hypothetical protein AAGO57_08735, partial [Pseudomonadota bacterium]